MDTIFKLIKVGNMGTNCYVFGTQNEVAVVDPGYEGEKILKIFEEHKLKLKYIVLTHGHFDHIGQVKYLKEHTEAQIIIHEMDADALVNPERNLSKYVGFESVIQLPADILAKDGDTFSLDSRVFTILHTPGHSLGGMCLLFEDCLFSGDTLFKETIGRTDLPYSDGEIEIKSIRRLMQLEDNIKVYPGHGDTTSIGHERRFNPFANK